MKRNHEKSSGNVFADLGFPNSEQELIKAKLTVRIYRLLKDRGLTQSEAAKLLGTTQAQVSTLMRCRPVSVSIGRLMEFLTILGQDVELTIKPVAKQKSGQQGRMSVTVKAARQIVLQVEGDEKYNKWSRSIAKKLQQDIIPLLHNDKDFDPIERLLEVMR